MCRGKTHHHRDNDQNQTGHTQPSDGDRRCECCDPAVRRARRREQRIRDRGHGADQVHEDYAAATVGERSAMAGDYREATSDPSPTVRAARARTDGLPEKDQDRLARDDRPRVRAAMAGNPTADGEVLDLLARDDDRCVREAVAANPNALSASLEHLGHGLDRRRDFNVARALRYNPATPTDVFWAWVESGTSGQKAHARHALAGRYEPQKVA